eukprot:CAMPEP_0170598682 /NCGR_PEP_ID=MMETSP0224-20130122/16380_1 /TAXON_ID=285029 /ORGANISM="Togula jolla, Strain CCCM 725" /LENGTH=535 /DNA_ID=CAMNT_0010923255 /DNA_START=102 /DNA_END=1709 /DNA_ORIENTATION=-
MTYGQGQMSLADDMSTLSTFETGNDSFQRKCKIICTMGPACWDVDMLVKLIDAGMNICRLNFSHGDHEGHGATVKRIREACKLRPGKNIAILLDTKGPEIRTGFFREDVGKNIELKQGQDLKLTTDYSFKGDSTCIALSYDKICSSVKKGNTILCADGSLSLRVKEVGSDYVMTEVMNSCKLGERKNCNLPGVKVELPVLQEKDIKDLVEFGIPQGVDFVAASFVQNAQDVKTIRDTLGKQGEHIKIISKIENEEGLKNFEAICDASDAIMVARGDLGMEIPPENVFLAQKMMIGICNRKGKPVVTATQMLESMVNLPRPTRAEASDVANAVLDSTDCVMLSGETANGAFPVEAVTIMRRVCEEAEEALDYPALFSSVSEMVQESTSIVSSAEAMASAAVLTSMDLKAKLILAVTVSGASATMLAKYRPSAPILAMAYSEVTVRQLLCVRGVVPVHFDSDEKDDIVEQGIYWAKVHGMVQPGDVCVAVLGFCADKKGAGSKPVYRRGQSMVSTHLEVNDGGTDLKANQLKLVVVR